MNKEVKKDSFSPKIYTYLDRHWNRGLHLKITAIIEWEKCCQKCHASSQMWSVSSQGKWWWGVLEKKEYQYLILVNWTFAPSFSPGVFSEKSGLLLIILKRINLRQTVWKTFSYTTKSLQSYKKWKAEHFNEKHWLRSELSSVSFPNNNIVYSWMRLQITTFLSTNYGMCIGAAPKPLEVHESLSTSFTGFSLGSSPKSWIC